MNVCAVYDILPSSPEPDVFYSCGNGSLEYEHQLPGVGLDLNPTGYKPRQSSYGQGRDEEGNETKVDGHLSIIIQTGLHDVVLQTKKRKRDAKE
jgi:hypothetical protein